VSSEWQSSEWIVDRSDRIENTICRNILYQSRIHLFDPSDGIHCFVLFEHVIDGMVVVYISSIRVWFEDGTERESLRVIAVQFSPKKKGNDLLSIFGAFECNATCWIREHVGWKDPYVACRIRFYSILSFVHPSKGRTKEWVESSIDVCGGTVMVCSCSWWWNALDVATCRIMNRIDGCSRARRIS